MLTKACDLVTKQILQEIMKGELKPGDKLPSTQGLAKLCGTSVLSAREAVQALANIGIVEISHGRGLFLTDGGPVIEELLEARRVLESNNAMMAAHKATPEHLQMMEDLLKYMDEKLRDGDIESYSGKDVEFHYAVAKASGNRILLKTLMNIRNLLYFQLFTINRLPNIIQRSTIRHRQIFDAICSRDPELARSSMWKHMTETIDSWKENVGPA